MQSCGTCAWVSLGYVMMRLSVLSVTSRCQSNLSNSNAFCLSGPSKNTLCICLRTQILIWQILTPLCPLVARKEEWPQQNIHIKCSLMMFWISEIKMLINSTSNEDCFHWYCLSHLHWNLSVESLSPDQWLCGWWWRTNTAHSIPYLAFFDSSVFP